MTIERANLDYRTMAAPAVLQEPPVYEPASDITRILGVVRRRYKLALAGAAVGAMLAVGFLSVIEPTYRSSIRILLDRERTKLLTEISGEQAPDSVDEYIATQIAVISSDIVARRVVHNLGLRWDPDARRLVLPPDTAPAQSDREARVTSEFLATAETDPAVVGVVQGTMAAYQVDKSLVIEIATSDHDPEIAQKLATAYGQAYITDQLSARFEATKNAGVWLEERINTLREQSLEASAAVERFRAENNLVSTDGRLVSDQALGSLNEQLIQARLAVTRAAAKVGVFRAAVDGNDVDEVISIVGSSTEIAENAPIRQMRSDYLQVSNRARDVTARWGEDNEQLPILTAEVERQGQMILAEARRILAGYESELRTAETEADATASAVASATGRSQADNSTLVALRSLEQRASSYNALYQDYLARYQEAVQQQTLSLTTGRLISAAEMPDLPVFPNKKVILAFLLLLGAGAGGAIGVARELLDRTFRSRSDVEQLGLDFLGYIPRSGEAVRRLRLSPFRRKRPAEAADPVTRRAAEIGEAAATLETTRIGIEIRRRGSNRVVALLSLEPSLTRASLALALAAREARTGRRVLLIDADTGGRRLSQALAREDGPTVADVSANRVPLSDAVRQIEPNLAFLAAAGGQGTAAPLAADALKLWAMDYDMVVVDLPPAGPISEARSLASAIDGFVCAVEWGQTPRHLLAGMLQASPNVEAKMVGVVVTDVNLHQQRLYDPDFARTLRRTTGT